MSQTDPAAMVDRPSEYQRTLTEFDGRCRETAEDTGHRCQHDAILGTGYCSQHLDWDEVDINTIGQ